VASTTTPLGHELTIRGTPDDNGKPAYYTFVLRRAGQSWNIIYDSVLSAALVPYVQGQEARRLDPTSKSADAPAKAVAAGVAAANDYRTLFLPKSALKSAESRAKRHPTPTPTPTLTPTPTA
jgi:hypothetical protein